MKENSSLDNKKIISLVSMLCFLIIIIGASFAYFGSFTQNISKGKVNITIDVGANATFVTSGVDLNIVIPPSKMVQYEAGTKAIENNTTLDVTLTSGNTKIRTTCTFDIYYEYNQNSSIYGDTLAPVTDASSKELTLKMGGNGTSDYSLEKNFNIDSNWINNSKRLVVKNATISDATTTGTTKSWDISMAFYNLDKDQNKLAGKTFSGTFYVEKDSINCDNESSEITVEKLMTPNNTDIFEEKGIRYEGADPNNYICLDNQTSGTCAGSTLLFRIIGLFDEEYSTDGTNSSGTKKLLKVIDTNNYGGTDGKYWDDGSLKNVSNNNFDTKYTVKFLIKEPTASKGTNNWNTASLKAEINGTYLTTLLNTSNVNSKLSSAIANAKWHLGGANDDNYKTLTAEGIYTEERNPSAIYSGNPSSIYAQVGLMYPSDYGYATVGGITTTKSSCRAKELVYWNELSYSDCINNDWLYTTKKTSWGSYNYEWILSPSSSNSTTATHLHSKGNVNLTGFVVCSSAFAVRPTFYLDASAIKIVGGNGTSTNPYRIG